MRSDARRDEQDRRALRRPPAGRRRRASASASRSRSATLAPRSATPRTRTSRRPAKSESDAPGGDEGFRGELVRVEDLAIPAGGLVVGQERPGQALDDLVDEEGLGPVEEEERWDAPGRGVAEEGGDLQLRTLRRRS